MLELVAGHARGVTNDIRTCVLDMMNGRVLQRLLSIRMFLVLLKSERRKLLPSAEFRKILQRLIKLVKIGAVSGYNCERLKL